MTNPKRQWHISVVRDTAAPQESWIATIGELPDFKRVAKTEAAAHRMIFEHSRAVMKLGDDINPLLLAHFNSPTIENWLACRKAGLRPNLISYNGLDLMWGDEFPLNDYGISKSLFVGMLDLQEEYIEKISLLLIEDVIKSKALRQRGSSQISRRRLVIPEEVIDWLICQMVDCYRWHDEEKLSSDLLALIRFRLAPGASSIDNWIAKNQN